MVSPDSTAYQPTRTGQYQTTCLICPQADGACVCDGKALDLIFYDSFRFCSVRQALTRIALLNYGKKKV